MRFYRCAKDLKFVLLACKDEASIAKAHALLISSGNLSRRNFIALLISLYAKIGHIESARQVFDKIPKRGIDAWNAMITAYSRKDCPNEVINLYKQMGVEPIKPDSSTFTIAIKACGNLLDIETGEEIRKRAFECGYEHDVFVGSSLLNLYAKCGKMAEAMFFFEKMRRRDLVIWTTMIMGFAQSKRPVEAVKIYRRMRREGVEGDEVVMLGLIQVCSDTGNTKMGLSIHGYVVRKEIYLDVVVQTSLIDMYAKNGNLEFAVRVFKNMGFANVVSWSTMISSHAQNGLALKTLELFVEMQSFGFGPDSISLASALLACSQIGFSKLGRSIHGYILKRLDQDQDHDQDRVLGTALIDAYSKCGLISSARSVFDQMISRDLISWNAMISSYGIHGCPNEALSLFLRMIETDVNPDHATFASLLSAFSHSGLVQEGKHWFNLMKTKFKIQPSEKHYACLVDLLARSGKVEEALEMVHSMPPENSGSSVWVALLSGCHNHRRLFAGEVVAKKVLELSMAGAAEESGVYSLVSNFYAAAEMWEEVAGVRRVMKSRGVKKVPGCSLVDVNGELHGFFMEDKNHPRYQEMAGVLDQLEDEMMDLGCNNPANTNQVLIG